MLFTTIFSTITLGPELYMSQCKILVPAVVTWEIWNLEEQLQNIE